MYFSQGNEKIKVLSHKWRHNEMQLNKTQSFSKYINFHIVSIELFFHYSYFHWQQCHKHIIYIFFLFKFPSFSQSFTFLLTAFHSVFPGWCHVKESACHCRRYKRHRFDPWVGKILWNRKWQHTPVFLPAKFYEQRILMGYSPCFTKYDCAAAHVFHSVTMKLPFPSLILLKFYFFHNIFWEIEFRKKEAEQECTREISF